MPPLPPGAARRRAVTAILALGAALLAVAGCKTLTDVPEPDRDLRLAYEAKKGAAAAAAVPPPGRPTKRPTGPLHILTQRYDTGRSGVTLRETALNPSNVNQRTFGRLFSRDVDGDLYAQPLYVSGMKLGGKVRNVVFVATEHDSVYAFDADDPKASAPLWKASLGRSVKPDEVGRAPYGPYRDYQREIGITGTPVIDLPTNTLYCSAYTRDPKGGLHHTLHVLDIRTGKPRTAPVEIKAVIAGKGVGGTNGKIPFQAKFQNQRAALLLDRGTIYVAFGSHADIQPYHGWLFAYDAKTLRQKAVWCSTPDGEGGGIWMAGVGPSVDAEGDLYIAIGDGSYTADRKGRDYGDSFVQLRLTPAGFTVQDYFTPYNQQYLNEHDRDVGSAGVVLPPGKRHALAGSKAGVMYVMDRAKMGGYSTQKDNILSRVSVTTGNIYGPPVEYDDPKGGPTVYVWGGYTRLKAYRASGDGRVDAQPAAVGAVEAPRGKPGGILSVSADADAPNTGIVWAYLPLTGNANRITVPGVLRAYDAADVGRELWNSEMVPERDKVGGFGKFCVPVVANGKVYVGTFSNKLHVYGLLPKP